ncbi:MAG TPA: hypothetical protein VFB99_01995 [Vicinamibacterales bacterium]|nr:hypothetical protein [Vicinamibacterales bacterium]
MMVRGATKVRAILAEEHCAMQARAYRRVRTYLADAMSRLHRAHPAFQTVVFRAEDAGFAFVFGDGTRPHEAPKAFCGLAAACKELAGLSEVERLTAEDPIWQVLRGTPQPEFVVEQYRAIQGPWLFWARRSICEARYYMRRDIYSRTVHGSHRPGFGKRLVSDDGAVVDEWIDPIEPMILRALRAGPADLDSLCCAMNTLSGFHDAHYIWDVLHACEQLRQRGMLRRMNPRSSDGDARFALRTEARR